MRNELSDRQPAIRMRLAGETVATIYRVLRRSDAWVRKWWHRYLNAGGEGLYDPVILCAYIPSIAVQQMCYLVPKF